MIFHLLQRRKILFFFLPILSVSIFVLGAKIANGVLDIRITNGNPCQVSIFTTGDQYESARCNNPLVRSNEYVGFVDGSFIWNAYDEIGPYDIYAVPCIIDPTGADSNCEVINITAQNGTRYFQVRCANTGRGCKYGQLTITALSPNDSTPVNVIANQTLHYLCNDPAASNYNSYGSCEYAPPPLPVVDITCNGTQGPCSVNSGQSFSIEWGSRNATSCNIDGTPVGTSGASGDSLTSSRTYTFTCSNSGGSVSDPVTVNVNGSTPPPPLPPPPPGMVNFNFSVANTCGSPISGALVTINQDFGNGTTRITDGNGFANFGVDKNKIIGWSVSASGYSSKSGSNDSGSGGRLVPVTLSGPCGGGSPPPPPPPPPGSCSNIGNSAQYVSQNVPTSLAVGEIARVSITMRNCGNTTWTAANNYKLGSQNPENNRIWTAARAYITGSVSPGSTYTFNFQITAPSRSGNYNFQWRMLRELVEWFGDYTPNLSIRVVVPNYTLATSIAGSGTITGPGVNCPGDCSESYTSGTSVTLSAAPAAGYSFAGWSGSCSGTGSCVLSMTQSHAVSASFTINSYNLSTSVSSGSGTITGSGINCPGDCSETYVSGTSVTLSAAPAAGYSFAGWSGSCSGVGSCVLSMTQSRAVSASFTINSYNLSTSVSSGSGTITGPGVNCPGDCSESYISGTWVSLIATPAADYTFSSWNGACAGQGSICSVFMDTAKLAGVNFAYTPPFNYSLSNSGNSNVTKTSGDAFTQNTITKTLISGGTEPVSLSLSGVPTGVSYSISSSSCSPSCNSTITFTVAPNTPVGTHSITVTGSPLGKQTSFNLIVLGNPITISCSANPLTVFLGQTVTWSASVSGGRPPFTYVWSGTSIPTNPAPNSNPFSISYNTIGQKITTVTVTDTDSTQATCPVATVQVNFDPLFEEF